MSLEVSKAGFVHSLHLVKHPCANEASLPGCRFRRAAPNQHQSEQDLGSGYKIGGHMGLQIRQLTAGNSTKSFAAFAALERGRQHKNLAKSLHVYWGSAAAPCFDSERVEPFVDISAFFAAKCPQ